MGRLFFPKSSDVKSCEITAATVPPHIVVFPLDSRDALGQNPRQSSVRSKGRTSAGESGPRHLDRRRKSAPVAEGKTICNFCPASRCNALIRNARREANGCAQTPLGPSVSRAAAPAAAMPCAMFRHRSARASACVHARLQRVRRCGLAPGNWAKIELRFISKSSNYPACDFASVTS